MASVRVVIVDDSAIVRRLLRRMVEDEPGFAVVGEGASGPEAVALAAQLSPDLMLIDLTMPGGNGIEALAAIMNRSPTRVVVVSSVIRYEGGSAIHAALEHGAVDLVSKNDVLADDGNRFRQRLRALAGARIGKPPATGAAAPPLEERDLAAVIIGASAGGPGALRELVSRVNPAVPASITIVQHMPAEFGEAFVSWLRRHARAPVQEAQHGTRARRGTIYVAVRGPHLQFEAGGGFISAPLPGIFMHTPAIDPFFTSAAAIYGSRAAGILLTGMGNDGVAGLGTLRKRGGLTIAEDENTAIVDGMPRAAREAGAASRVMPLDAIANWLASLH